MVGEMAEALDKERAIKAHELVLKELKSGGFAAYVHLWPFLVGALLRFVRILCMVQF